MKSVIILILLSLWIPVCAQQPADEPDDLQRFSDDLAGSQDEDASYEDVYENLVLVMTSPYDLNNVSESELQLLHILSDTQIENFIAYRKDQEQILDVHELQVIPGFDPGSISRLLPFVKVKDPMAAVNRSLVKRMFSFGNSYLVSRYERTIETKKGFKPSQGNPPAFTGSPEKMYVRWRSSEPGDYSIGITGEKDSGEKLSFNLPRHQLGFDFTSFHVQLQHKGKIRNIIGGDFQAQFGQGLLLGGAFGLGKGGETVSTVRKSNVGFLPYTSVNENAFQRGLALTLQPLAHFLVSVFYSNTRRDAASGHDTDSLYVSSLPVSGLHRTESELSSRKKVREENYGAVLQFSRNTLDAGVIFNATHFDMPVSRVPVLYNNFAFAGSRNLNAGIFLNYRWQNISFFGEAARSLSGGTGAIAGMLISAHQHLDLAIVYRNYGRNFHAFYSNAFSESTKAANERGLYWGWKYRWSRSYNLTGYVDLFTFPWLGYRRYAPAGGYEWLLRGNYYPSRKVSLYLQLREELKPANAKGMTTVYQVQEGMRRNATLHCDYGIGENISMKSRLQYNIYSFHGQTSEGMALIQDVSFKWGAFKFSGRHALFETDHHDNRLYVYEQDAWLAYSLPAYSGVGVRNYALFEYQLIKHRTVWVRYARTRLTKPGEIGTGQDVIEGNTKNDVKFQARFKF